MSAPETYPVERDGRVVWACCESSIGGPCGHRAEATAGEETPAAAEPWCNHDPAAVRRGVCECGVLVRVDTLAEIVQEWADHDGGPLQEAMDRMDSALEQLGARPMTDDERAAVVARIEG